MKRVTDDIATSVYRYYDADGQILYVGVTNRGDKRNREHARDKAWWHLVASSTVQHFATRRTALAEELRLIEFYRPPYNTVGKPDGERRHIQTIRLAHLRAALGRTSRVDRVDDARLNNLIPASDPLRPHVDAALKESRRKNESVPEFRLRLKALAADC